MSVSAERQFPADAALIEGAVSVLAVLDAASRPIHALLIAHESRYDAAAAALLRRARDAGIAVEHPSAETFAGLVQGKTHGGIAAWVGERRVMPLETLLGTALTPFLVMLDGVEDPFNFGQAVRAFYAAGADGLIVRPRNWLSAAGVVARASAGASERIAIAEAASVEAAADVCRAHGLTIAVTDHRRAQPLYQADLTRPVLIVIGGEKRGVTRSFADAADLRLAIPYGREFAQALDTTSAAAAIAFEVLRQRRYRA